MLYKNGGQNVHERLKVYYKLKCTGSSFLYKHITNCVIFIIVQFTYVCFAIEVYAPRVGGAP